MFDHWAYMSTVGFAIFLPWVVIRLIHNDRLSRVVLLIIVLGLSGLTYQRNKVWQTEIGLWEDVLQKNPKTLVHYLALGIAYDRKGRWQDAEFIYHKAIGMYEHKALTDTSLKVQKMYVSRIYNNWGIIVADREQNDPQAIDFFKRAIEFDKNNADAQHNLSIMDGSGQLETDAQISTL